MIKDFKNIDNNTFLINEAPAMYIILQMLIKKVARLEISGSLVEFCYNGIRYYYNGDWKSILDCIGWENAKKSIS